jgi:hypothetical protein
MIEKPRFKLWYDEENEVIRAIILETLDAEASSSFLDSIKENFEPEKHRYFFVDLSPEKSQTLHDKETRRTLRKKMPQVNWSKIAILGANPGIRMLTKIIMAAAGKARNAKFFDNEEEGLAWLKAEKEKEKEKESK